MPSSGKSTVEVEINNTVAWQRKHLGSLIAAYGAALGFTKLMPRLQELYAIEFPKLVEFTIPGILLLKELLGIQTRIVRASDHWIPTYLRRPIAVTFNLFGKLLAKGLDGIVVATEGIAEKFQRLNPVVVHNYPNLQMLPNPPPAPRGGKEKILVYVGGISKIRGALEMVRALEYLNHIDSLHLDLVGKFDPPGLEQELQIVQGYRRVRFLGWLQPSEVYERLKEADIGLVFFHPVPNHVEAQPVKLFEYMAAGLPVIASNFPLWREIVEGNHCGLCVDPLDPKAIAQAIEYLLTHPEEARRMGENGRRAVLEKYNWEREGEILLKLYEELVKR